jgi:hypothetical protein
LDLLAVIHGQHVKIQRLYRVKKFIGGSSSGFGFGDAALFDGPNLFDV